MGSKRREFTPEYKDEAVKLVINTGRPIARVARELGVTEQSLGRWVNAYRARQEDGDGALNETDRAELLRLRKENSELKVDRAFLNYADVQDGSPARGFEVGVLCLVQTCPVESGGPSRADRAEGDLVPWRVR